MLNKITVVLGSLLLCSLTSSVGNALSIPALSRHLSVDASSTLGGCNLLTGRCEFSTISIDWNCDTVGDVRTCSGTLSRLHLLNGSVITSITEPLTDDQVVYNRYQRRITVTSASLATTVQFSEMKSPEDKRRTELIEDASPSAGVCGQGCYWIPRSVTRVRSFVLKSAMDGFVHPIDGGQLEESLEISYTKERFL